MIKIFAYFFVVTFLYIDVYLMFRFIEYVYCAFIIKQPPNVASSKPMMQKVVEQIKLYYADAQNICDIGSGYGFMARFIANNTNASVVGFENVMFSAFVSKVLNLFCFGKVRTKRCDAYEYLQHTKEIFDVAVAYLGPDEVQNLEKYKQKIRVLICLDFKIKNLKPIRIMNVGHGFTRFNHKKYPHKLFIYEFK